MEEEIDYPGIDRNGFEIVLNDEFYPMDIISMVDEYYVIGTKKVLDNYVTRLVPCHIYLHDMFLIKYSEFLLF